MKRTNQNRDGVSIRPESWPDLAIPAHIVWRDVPGDLVLFDSASGQYFFLDEVASRIWREIHHQQSFAAVLEDLAAEYHGDPQRIAGDVLRFVAQARQKGLLALRAGGGE